MDPILEQLHTEQHQRVSNAPTRRERLVELGVGIVLVGATALLMVLSAPAQPDWLLVGAIVAVYAASWQVTFEIGPGTTTPLQVVFVPMWFVVDPALLPILVAAGQVVGNAVASARDRNAHPWSRVPLGIPDAWYALGPAIVLVAFDVTDLAVADWPVLVAAFAAQFLLDGTGAAVRCWALSGMRLGSQLRVIGWMWMVDSALAPIGVLVAFAMTFSGWALVAVLPLIGLLSQFARERDDRILKALELSHAYRGTAQLMGDVLEADDAYTGGEHTQGVVELALRVGQTLGLDAAQMRNLEFGALLHDVGKLRVPDAIINKPGKLDEAEWAIIKEHPRYGQEMLDRVGGALSDAGIIVRAHHERWDGGGYPDGLLGDEIPIEARIITVCDSFSAMTTNRSYRRGMSQAEAAEELGRCSGTQFDPQVVAAVMHTLPKPDLPAALSALETRVDAAEDDGDGASPDPLGRPDSAAAAA